MKEKICVELPRLPDVREIVIDGVVYVNLSAALPALKSAEAPQSLRE